LIQAACFLKARLFLFFGILMELTSEQRDFILAHEREDVRETALRFVRDDMPLLSAQIAGRQMA
jgi:hypothetical protein